MASLLTPPNLAAAVLLAAYATCIQLFNKHVPYSYMDEPFHVQQTQQYCSGNYWEWDPKITTFPGLYLAALPFASAVQTVLQLPTLEKACTTDTLRYLNVAMSIICFVLFYRLHLQLHSATNSTHTTKLTPSIELSRQALLCALVLATCPLHFFYAFLYYTDVGGVLFTCLCYLLALRGHTFRASLAGAIAVLFRQTNAVWVAFVLGACVIEYCKEVQEREQPGNLQHPRTLATELASVVWVLRYRLRSTVVRFLPLAMVPVAFAAFVLHNGGVAVGDRAAHKPVPHVAQMLYFSLFAVGSLAPVHLNLGQLHKAVVQLRGSIRSHPVRTLALLMMAVCIATAVVSRFTLVHPYLLADNRHYMFYLWRRLLGWHPLAKYLLIPAYLYSWWSLHSRLAAGRSGLWLLGLLLCCTAVLVPAWLLEFRYYVMPFMILVLNMQPTSERQWWMCCAQNAVVNAVTLYIFLFRPFTWGDGSQARFMW